MASAEKEHALNSSRKRKRSNKFVSLKPQPSPSAVNSQAPRGINVVEFAEARALELHNMVEGISMGDKTGKKRLFQSLPKHMRRRAMSYNVKRMPVRLREQAKKEMDKVNADSKTKKSRRQRRKPKVLLEDYNRRKKNNIWLETHIWHAKRMKMVNVWGYRLAECPTDKGFRAAHRAVANSCLLQDISYYGCIEVKGDRSQILSAMSQLTIKELGPTIGSLDCINFAKEGHVVLYHPNEYPYGAIGPASFMWRQHPVDGPISVSCHSSSIETNETFGDDKQFHSCSLSTLWIWVYPSCFSEALKAIGKSVTSNGGLITDSQSTFEADNKFNSKQDALTVKSLQHDLVRFRLTGPLSHSLLVSALELASETGQSKHGEQGLSTSGNLINGSNLPLEMRNTPVKVESEGNNTTKHSHVLIKQHDDPEPLSSTEVWEVIKTATSSSVLPSNSIIALTVTDPRLGLPGIRTSIDRVVKEQQTTVEKNHSPLSGSRLFYSQWPAQVAASNLWDSHTRQRVKETKIEEQKINQMRSNLLVPGSLLDTGEQTSLVPIVLVQQPGSRGYGGGWDIILPSGWAMGFWMSLVYRGARVGGLRESRNCALEREEPHFPGDVPDTRAGMAHNDALKTEGQSKHDRYPPAKRPNYHKLGVLSPFCVPWDQLAKEWILEGQKLIARLNSEKKCFISEQNDCKQIDSKSLPSGIEIDTKSLPSGIEIDSKSLPSGIEIDSKSLPSGIEIDGKSLPSGIEIDGKSLPSSIEIDTKSLPSGTEIDSKSLPSGTEIDSKSLPSGIEIDTKLLPSVIEIHGKSLECNMEIDSFRKATDEEKREFYVLRNLSQLRCLRNVFVKALSRKIMKSLEHGNDYEESYLRQSLDVMKANLPAVLGVSLRMLHQGCPQGNATVSIPSLSDYEALQRCKTYGGPVEPLHKGPKLTSPKHSGNDDTMIGHSTRKVIGFVTSGQYSLSRGCGVGVAYCALPGIVELLSQAKGALVLVRNTTSQQYRFAQLSVL